MSRKEEQIRVRTKGKSYVPRKKQATDAKAEETAAPRRKRRKRRLWWRVLVVALVCVALFLVWKNWDTLNPVSAWDWLSLQITGGAKGDGFPHTLEGSTVLQMQPVKNRLALLTDNALVLLNGTAGETARRTHSFARPQMSVAGEYVLLCEVGGKRVRLETEYATKLQKTLSGTAVTAAVAEDGSFAVVTEATGSHMSEVILYDRDGKEKYHWYSSDLLVTDVALTTDGKQMAAVGVTAIDGACESRLMVFDVTDFEATPQRYVGTDVLLAAVEYVDDKTLAAIGDEAVWIVRPKEDAKTSVSYDTQQLLQYAVSEERVILVRERLGSTSGGVVTALDTAGNVVYQSEFTGAFRDVAATEDTVLLLTDKTLYCYDEKGGRTETAVSSDGILVAGQWDRALVLGLTSLTEIDTEASE